MERIFMLAASALGFLGVALGAFGAHGLQSKLAELPDFAQRMQWWQTAAHYHLIHAVALGLCAAMVSRSAGTAANVSGYAFIAGVVLFSGSLYVMTLTGMRGLGAVTPLAACACWRAGPPWGSQRCALG